MKSKRSNPDDVRAPKNSRDTRTTAPKTHEQPVKSESTLDAAAADGSVPAPEPTSQSNSPYVKLLDELRPELDALDPSSLLVPNVDIPTAIHYARSALPVLELLRPRAASLGPELDMKLYDRVSDYARLLQYAHGSYLASLTTADTVTDTYGAAIRTRDFLLAWGPGLVASKLLPQTLIDQVRSGTGFQDTITDITTLTSALRAIWPEIEGKVLITADQLDEADALAEKLAAGVALRDSLVETVTKRATDRQLAFTLFVRAYNEARAAAIFLRRNDGDGEKLVPSIYSKAPGARRKDDEPAPSGPIESAKSARPTQPVSTQTGDQDGPTNQSSPFSSPPIS